LRSLACQDKPGRGRIFEVTSDTQAIKDAYTEKLKALYTVMADAFIDGENKAAAERDFQKAVKLARQARDTAIGLLPK
jgi:polysaccharide deacetylase 2 family uncharacterized protein YibQ